MFLIMDTYFLEEGKKAQIDLYNGSFRESENTIARDRMIDVSVVGGGSRQQMKETDWTTRDSITALNFTAGKQGTWVAGVSTRPRNITLAADKFNSYLEHDGIEEMLQKRRDSNQLDRDATERYSKHVKAIYQVGDSLTEDWNMMLSYPIEFVPLENPYSKSTGDKLRFKLLRDGQPLADQLVYAGFKASAHGHSHVNHSHKHQHVGEEHEHEHGHDDGEHSHSHSAEKHSHKHQHDSEEHEHEHGHDDGEHSHSHSAKKHSHTHQHGGEEHEHEHGHEDGEHSHNHEADAQPKGHSHDESMELRTDENGEVELELTHDGIWYIRTIHMVEKNEGDLTHESNWATLTFEVRHSHDDDHAHGHDHDHEGGIPDWVYWAGSVAILFGLYFFFRSRNKNADAA